jgi:hypothetical protein
VLLNAVSYVMSTGLFQIIIGVTFSINFPVIITIGPLRRDSLSVQIAAANVIVDTRIHTANRTNKPIIIAFLATNLDPAFYDFVPFGLS